jgi:flagellar biosynthetic protein FlhB
MEENEKDKTEQATPYKLDKARKKGVVARGADLGFMASTAAFFCYAWIAGPHFGEVVARIARESWLGGPQLSEGNNTLLSAVSSLSTPIVPAIILLMAIVFASVLLLELVQTGFVFSAEPFGPDFSRLNPANGLKRVFSLRALIETGKNILKIFVYVTTAILVARYALRSEVGGVSDATSLSAVLQRTAVGLLAAFVLGAMFFAVLDQLIVRNIFRRNMRMSRRELRRESREREGEPRLKQKRKQLHRELAKSSQSLRNLRKADVLITNPQHLAVALRYDPRTMLAPTVVSMGKNYLAQRLKHIAFLYGIPTIEDRPLAQRLFQKAALNNTIPQDCYKPVADIYNTIRAKARRTDRANA